MGLLKIERVNGEATLWVQELGGEWVHWTKSSFKDCRHILPNATEWMSAFQTAFRQGYVLVNNQEA